MGANELTIGDWISANSNTPSKIIEICGKANVIFTNDSDRPTDLCEVFPVPLTEDILRANEFIHIEDYGSWTKDCFSIYKFHHKLYANGCGCSVVVEYVHQLQHLLRDFGLNDMADNFKVE